MPLENGDRRTVAEFERRYAADPNVNRAELIEGIVYVASPLRFRHHANPHAAIIGWLSIYWFATPGTQLADAPTVRLDDHNEPQPDVVLFREDSENVEVNEDDYLVGAPELIVEISGSTASYDLGSKLDAYERNGVAEYLVWSTGDRTLTWLALNNETGKYDALEPDENGIFRSQVFPGLWLDGLALLEGNLPQVLAIAQKGLGDRGGSSTELST